MPNFVEYLHSYASHFKLDPHINLNQKVVGLQRTDDPSFPHVATIRNLSRGSSESSEHTIHARRVVITTGLHVTPNIPSISGLTSSPTSSSPQWIHSSSYKSRSQLRDKSVLVLGAGETGMDVAYESVLSPAKRTTMGVRTGFLSFPKVLNNFRVLGSTFDGALPIDGLITNLFETAYVHPWVAASHLRWFVSDFVIKRVLYVLTGTQAGCNQWAGELPPERQGRAYVFLNKSAKAMQFINTPFYRLGWLHRLVAHYIDPPTPKGITDPTIHLTPFPERFDENGRAVFPPPPAHRRKEKAWTEECKADLVVLCTGYKQEWGWLGDGYAKPEELDLRGVVSSKDTSVGYIGFLRPGVGECRATARLRTPVGMSTDDRRNSTHGGDANPVLPLPHYGPDSPAVLSRELPPPSLAEGSNPVRRRLLDVHGHACAGHWRCTWSQGSMGRVRLVRRPRIQVSLGLVFLEVARR